MSEQTVSALIEGGKATAGPPLGPALGPLGINTGKVVADINEKTKSFEGITVPVKVIIDTSSKNYVIEIGSPSVSSLIKKELGIKKGSGKAAEQKVGSITIDQIIKIARSKKEFLLAKTDKSAVKEVIGACVPMGVLIDEKTPQEVIKEVNEGKYDNKITGKEALKFPTAEELAEMRKKYSAVEEKKEEPKGKAKGKGKKKK